MEKIDLDAIYVARTQDELDCFKHYLCEIFRNNVTIKRERFYLNFLNTRNHVNLNTDAYGFDLMDSSYDDLEKIDLSLRKVIEVSDFLEVVNNVKIKKIDDDIYFPEDIYIFKNQQNQLKCLD